MGKRIPGKKHKGVKDPLVQNATREEALKHQINAPPKNIDHQEIPKSVERLMKLKKMTKEGKFDNYKKKKRNKTNLLDTTKFISKEKILPGMSKPDRNLPALVQRSGENKRAFLNRVHQATDEFIKEVNFEIKYNMKMKRDEKTGQVKFDKVELHPVDQMFQDKLETTNRKKLKQKKGVKEDVLSKTARRRLRQQALRENQRSLEGEGGKEDEFARFTDKIEFNEVVHRPPELTALPRKVAAYDTARRPGNKPGLLLTQLFSPQDGPKRDLTGPRKELSASDRRRLDTAQAEAIEAYRQMKAGRGVRSTAVT